MAEPAERPDIKSWLSWALVASLGTNLFLGGFVVSRSMSQNSDKDLPKLVDIVVPRGIPQGLSIEVREQLENQVRLHRRELRIVYRDYSRTQREIGRLLAAEKFDTEALEQEYELLRELGVRIQIPIQDALIAAARDMDAANRRTIIQFQRLDENTIRFITPDRLDGRRWKFQRGEGFQFFMTSDDSDQLEDENDDNSDNNFR